MTWAVTLSAVMECPVLDEARRLLQDGVVAGHHRGVQLAVLFRGEALELNVGQSHPDQPMATGVLLPWFSCTKILTATAVAVLVERGVLDYDTAVGTYIPEFATGGKEHVRLWHVLTHTAGFRGPADRLPSGSSVAPEAVVEQAVATPLEDSWVPGERAAYQPRGGFAVLAETIARASGSPFIDFVTDEVIEPLGLADTWMHLPAAQAARYGSRMGSIEDRVTGKPRLCADLTAAELPSDGSTGAIGPARDLVRLLAALGGGGEIDGERILRPESVTTMTRRRREGLTDETFGAVIDWGLGVMVNSWRYRQAPAPYGYGDLAGEDAFGHGGARSSVAFADPANDLAVALIANGLVSEPVNHRRTQPALTALYRDLGLG